jgi:DNA-binding protein H-NS
VPRTQTLAALKEQRDRLDAQIAKIQHQQIPGVIAKIKVAIDHYGITAEQLFNGQAKPATKVAAVKTRKGPRKALAKKAAVAKPKPFQQYRDPVTGETWTGHGPRPQWLRLRLEQGRQLEDYKT